MQERRQTHHDATAEVAIALRNITGNASAAYFWPFDRHFRVGILSILDIEVEGLMFCWERIIVVVFTRWIFFNWGGLMETTANLASEEKWYRLGYPYPGNATFISCRVTIAPFAQKLSQCFYTYNAAFVLRNYNKNYFEEHCFFAGKCLITRVAKF